MRSDTIDMIHAERAHLLGALGRVLTRSDVSGVPGVATAESVTAGRVAAALASIEHASTFFRGGVVAYQESLKRELLWVTAPSVYSEQAAVELAAGAARVLRAEIGIGVTGLAGRDAIDGVEPGTVFMAVWWEGDVSARTVHIAERGERLCERAHVEVLRMLLDVTQDLTVYRDAAAGIAGHDLASTATSG